MKGKPFTGEHIWCDHCDTYDSVKNWTEFSYACDGSINYIEDVDGYDISGACMHDALQHDYCGHSCEEDAPRLEVGWECSSCGAKFHQDMKAEADECC